jgi:toxin ParE1/3/4
MDRRVIWLPAAVEDVEGIAAHIACDSPTYASVVVHRILSAAADLRGFSERGRVVPEWDDASIREVFVHSWRLIYQVTEHAVIILAALHGARLLPESLRERAR